MGQLIAKVLFNQKVMSSIVPPSLLSNLGNIITKAVLK
jgi:hypothetical protein